MRPFQGQFREQTDFVIRVEGGSVSQVPQALLFERQQTTPYLHSAFLSNSPNNIRLLRTQ